MMQEKTITHLISALQALSLNPELKDEIFSAFNQNNSLSLNNSA